MACNFRLQRFCCCCTVRTGSLVIGTLGWVFTLLQLFGVAFPRSPADHPKAQTEQEREIEKLLESINSDSLGARIGYAVLALIVSVLLIWGIYKKDRRFILPYLVVECLECILFTIFTIIIFVFIFLVPAEMVVVAVVGFILLLLCLMLCWYFWLCVWSHYKELEEAGRHPPVYYSPTSASPPTEKDRQQMI